MNKKLLRPLSNLNNYYCKLNRMDINRSPAIEKHGTLRIGPKHSGSISLIFKYNPDPIKNINEIIAIVILSSS